MQLKLYFNDWIRDSFGGPRFFPAGELSRSCARWVSLDKTFVELLPGEKQSVSVRMEVPDSESAVSEMKWTMLMIETMKEKKLPQRNEHFAMTSTSRVGVHIYQTPISLTNAEVKILNFCAAPGSDSTYWLVCQNVGNVQYELRSYVELKPLSEDGDKITLPAKIMSLFPDQKRYITFSIPPSVPKGKYNAVAIAEAGADAPLEAAQAVIEVK